MAQPPRIKRPMDGLKRFSVAISEAAHRRLREGSDALGIGQDHVLTLLLEKVNFDLIKGEAAELLRQYLDQRKSRAPTSASVEAFLKQLPPEERDALLKKVVD